MLTQTTREMISLVRDSLQIIVLGIAVFAIISGCRDKAQLGADNAELMQYVKYQIDLSKIDNGPVEVPVVDEE